MLGIIPNVSNAQSILDTLIWIHSSRVSMPMYEWLYSNVLPTRIELQQHNFEVYISINDNWILT